MPGGFSATATGRNSVRLTWGTTSGIARYYLTHKFASEGTWTQIASPGGTVGTYNVSGLKCGTAYRFAVKGYGDGQTYEQAWGAYSYANATTSSCPTPLSTPPAPGGFSATATGQNSVGLTWGTTSGIIRYYLTYRLASGVTWTEIARPGGTVDTYDVSGLKCGTAYRFAVKAHGDGQTYSREWGAYSYYNATTDDCDDPSPPPPPPPTPSPTPVPPPQSPPPDKVTGLTGMPGSQRGWVVLDWNSTDNTNSYMVLQLKNGSYTELRSPTEVSIDFEETTAVVLGLDPAVEHIYSFKVKAVNNHASSLSTPFTVNLRPPPKNLIGEYKDGEYGKLTLTWDAVPNPNATYIVEQHFPDLIPFENDWHALPLDGVSATITNPSDGKVQAVISPIAVGATFKHRVRADSVQGLSEPSNETQTTVTDERPQGFPSGLTFEYLIGYRGITLLWNDDSIGATSYEVETAPTDSLISISRVSTRTDGRKSVEITGLDTVRYRFIIYGKNSAGRSETPALLLERGPVPSYGKGHQADHTVKYVEGMISSTAVRDTIDIAAKAWNLRMNYGLKICDDVDISCNGRNSDKGIVTIKTVATTKDNTHAGCVGGRACVTHGTYGVTHENIGGRPRHNMEMIIESPAYTCPRNEKGCSSPTKFLWTGDSKLHNKRVDQRDRSRGFYAYIGYTLLHEFGHPLGLPDFYKRSGSNWDSRLSGVTAIMNLPWEAKSIRTPDIAQLDAIYIRHTRHAVD